MCKNRKCNKVQKNSTTSLSFKPILKVLRKVFQRRFSTIPLTMNFSMFIGSRELILHLIEVTVKVKNFSLERVLKWDVFSRVTVMIVIELDHIFPPNN